MAKTIDNNGFWDIKNNPISKIGVFPYLGRNISPELEPNKIYYVYRPADELFDEETIKSFNDTPVPLVDEHEMIGKGFTPAEEKGIEGVVSNVRRDGDKLIGDISIYSEKMKQRIENGKKDLSMGYFCSYELADGEYNGEHYDAIQRNIRANHVAVVDNGRCGSEVCVYDSFSVDADFVESDHPRKKDGRFTKKGTGEAGENSTENSNGSPKVNANNARKPKIDLTSEEGRDFLKAKLEVKNRISSIRRFSESRIEEMQKIIAVPEKSVKVDEFKSDGMRNVATNLINQKYVISKGEKGEIVVDNSLDRAGRKFRITERDVTVKKELNKTTLRLLEEGRERFNKQKQLIEKKIEKTQSIIDENEKLKDKFFSEVDESLEKFPLKKISNALWGAYFLTVDRYNDDLSVREMLRSFNKGLKSEEIKKKRLKKFGDYFDALKSTTSEEFNAIKARGALPKEERYIKYIYTSEEIQKKIGQELKDIGFVKTHQSGDKVGSSSTYYTLYDYPSNGNEFTVRISNHYIPTRERFDGTTKIRRGGANEEIVFETMSDCEDFFKTKNRKEFQTVLYHMDGGFRDIFEDKDVQKFIAKDEDVSVVSDTVSDGIESEAKEDTVEDGGCIASKDDAVNQSIIKEKMMIDKDKIAVLKELVAMLESGIEQSADEIEIKDDEEQNVKDGDLLIKHDDDDDNVENEIKEEEKENVNLDEVVEKKINEVMDSVDFFNAIEKKQELISKVRPLIGDFNYSKMSNKQIAKYACDKLDLEATEKTAEDVLNCYLKIKPVAKVFASDEVSEVSTSIIDKYLRGE